MRLHLILPVALLRAVAAEDTCPKASYAASLILLDDMYAGKVTAANFTDDLVWDERACPMPEAAAENGFALLTGLDGIYAYDNFYKKQEKLTFTASARFPYVIYSTGEIDPNKVVEIVTYNLTVTSTGKRSGDMTDVHVWQLECGKIAGFKVYFGQCAEYQYLFDPDTTSPPPLFQPWLQPAQPLTAPSCSGYDYQYNATNTLRESISSAWESGSFASTLSHAQLVDAMDPYFNNDTVFREAACDMTGPEFSQPEASGMRIYNGKNDSANYFTYFFSQQKFDYSNLDARMEPSADGSTPNKLIEFVTYNLTATSTGKSSTTMTDVHVWTNKCGRMSNLDVYWGDPTQYVELFTYPSPPSPPASPPTAVNNDAPCFAAETTTACKLVNDVTAAEARRQCYGEAEGADAELVLMKTLVAGDIVLAADAVGALSLERVVVNQHKANARASALLEVHHSAGVLSLTPDHVLLVDGAFVPARDAKPGSALTLADGKAAVVERVVAAHGAVVNPVTASGTIVADGVVAATHPEWSWAFMSASETPLPLFYAASAAFPVTTQAYYDAVLEPLFDALGAHVKPAALGASALVAPFVAADAAAALGLAVFAGAAPAAFLVLGAAALRSRKA